MLPDVASEALDYNNIKRRAMSSRSYRVRIAPSNKTAFSAGETIFLDLPSNLSGTFMDMSQTYIRMKVTYGNTSTGANNSVKMALDKCGAYGFFQRVACITSGQQIYDLNNYNVLVAALMDTDASNDWKANAGNVLVGTTAATCHGESFLVPNGGVSRTYCLPFILNPFALQKKLVPLFSLDSLRWRITLESFANAVIQETVVDATTSISFSDVELITYFTELSPSAMAQLDSLTGGVYNLLCPSYSNTQTTMAAGTTVLNSVLGIAVSSLERILLVHRNSSAISDIDSQSLGARITNKLTTAQYFVNSESFPQRSIQLDDMGAEPLAEYLIADHALSDFSRSNGIQNFNVSKAQYAGYNIYSAGLYNTVNRDLAAGGAFLPANNAWNNETGQGTATGLTDADALTDVGSFILAIELETGCSAGRSDRLYSGISTISSVVQYKGTYGAGAVAATLDFFAQFTVLLTLNMRQTGVWSITI